MKGRLNTLLTVSAALAVAATASAQGRVTNHVISRGYAQTTYWSAPGLSATFYAAQNAVVNDGPETQIVAHGSASQMIPGGMVLYVPTHQSWNGTLTPTNHAFLTPGSASVSFSARRMQYAFVGFGIQLQSVTEGTITAYSVLENPTLIQRTIDHDRNVMTLPGLGVLFQTTGTYTGRIGFHPTGWGGMAFTATDGTVHPLIADGTPVNAASWMGHLHSAYQEVVSP